ncbi:UNVERIFIED_CONTAM: Hydroxysteroid dehydrogenase-like protein 1 [Trichonephila clavipes]
MIDVLNLASSKQRRMASVDNFSFLFQGINRNLRVYEEILAIIGLLYVGKTAFAFTWSFLQGVHTHVLARFRRLDLTRYGKWAVVTGGTDGIGKEYARALAKHGLNIIIISRSKEKLEKTAQEIEKDFKVQTYIIQADFAAGREIYNNISKQLEDKEIGILINNVGVMYDYPETFMNVPEKKLWELININIASVTMMTYIIIPQMVRRKKGVVVNMSSISSFHPLPLMAVYSASKGSNACNTILSVFFIDNAVPALLYADDFVFWSIGSDIPKLESALNSALVTLENDFKFQRLAKVFGVSDNRLPIFKPTTFLGHLRYSSANLDLVLAIHKHNSLLAELRSTVLATIHERYPDQDWLHVFTNDSVTASFGRAAAGAFSNSFNLKELLSAWSDNFDGKQTYLCDYTSMGPYLITNCMTQKLAEGTKVFVDWFSRALSYEYKDQGIVVQSLIPSYISTNLTRFSSFLQRPSFIVPDAKRFVNSAIQTIGVSNRTTGFWSHGLQYWMYDFMPASVWYRTSWLMQKVIDTHKRNEKKE